MILTMNSFLTGLYFIYERIGHAKLVRYLYLSVSIFNHFLYLQNICIRKLCHWVGLSSKIYKANPPLMGRVFRKSYPFKILWIVVCLDSVNVIDRQGWVKPIAECRRHESMNKIFPTLSIVLALNVLIPIRTKEWRKNLAGTLLSKLFPAMQVRSDSLKSSNSPLTRYLNEFWGKRSFSPDFHNSCMTV